MPIGTLLGLAMGGLVADAYGWRAAFMVAAAPGLVLAAVIALTVKEPRARAAPGPRRIARSLVQPFRDLADTVRALPDKPHLLVRGAGLPAFPPSSATPSCSSPPRSSCAATRAELAAIAAGFGLKSKGFLGPALGLVTGVGGIDRHR